MLSQSLQVCTHSLNYFPLTVKLYYRLLTISITCTCCSPKYDYLQANCYNIMQLRTTDSSLLSLG